MERTRFIIAGIIGSASTWLAQALRENTSIEPRKIVHEWFSDNLYEAQELWASDVPLCGSVGHDFFWMEQIQQLAPETKWAFIWRTPLDQIMSMVRKNWKHIRLRAPDAVPGFATKAAVRQWFAVEDALARAEKLGIELTHWHLDYYTAPNGFDELRKLLVPEPYRTPVVKLPSAVNVSRPAPFALNEQTAEDLLARFNALPRMKAAYESARRS